MRLATYNVENLFVRARALNLDTWTEGKKVLEEFVALNELIEEPAYTNEIKAKMVALMKSLGISKKNDSRFVQLRENRGQLVKYSAMTGTRIVARGREDWSGWVELRTELVGETSTRNSAQVVRDVAADVIGLIEVEDRHALRQFSEKLLPDVNGVAYDQTMLIDGNDDRGIDVGLMARQPYRVGWMRSHVDDADARGRRIFSRDCPEYSIWTPSGASVWLLVNHFKSKGFGTVSSSNARRRLQATRVRDIYYGLKAEGVKNIAVIGDLNDTPESAQLEPLINGTDLKDVFLHPSFDDGGFPGTFGLSNKGNKIDYMLLSPDLFSKVTASGVFRKGMWPGARPKRWEVFPELTRPNQSASDHAAVWADIDI